jgi:hypothetical protein
VPGAVPQAVSKLTNTAKMENLKRAMRDLKFTVGNLEVGY